MLLPKAAFRHRPALVLVVQRLADAPGRTSATPPPAGNWPAVDPGAVGRPPWTGSAAQAHPRPVHNWQARTRPEGRCQAAMPNWQGSGRLRKACSFQNAKKPIVSIPPAGSQIRPLGDMHGHHSRNFDQSGATERAPSAPEIAALWRRRGGGRRGKKRACLTGPGCAGRGQPARVQSLIPLCGVLAILVARPLSSTAPARPLHGPFMALRSRDWSWFDGVERQVVRVGGWRAAFCPSRPTFRPARSWGAAGHG